MDTTPARSSRGTRRRFVRSLLTVCALAPVATFGTTSAWAEGEEIDYLLARALSGPFLPYAIGGSVSYLCLGDHDLASAEELGLSLGASALVTSWLKGASGLTRPNGEPRGFPSGHASAAFTWATCMAHRHPDDRWLYYGAASAVSWSRVELRRHYLYQILGGALVGHLMAELGVKDSHALLDRVSVGGLEPEGAAVGRPSLRFEVAGWKW